MKLMQSACAIFSVVFQGREGWGDVGGCGVPTSCLLVWQHFALLRRTLPGFVRHSPILLRVLAPLVRFADVRLVLGLVATFLGAHPLGGAPDFSLVLPVVFTAKHNLAALHTQNSIIYKIVIRSSFGSNNYFLKQYVCRL